MRGEVLRVRLTTPFAVATGAGGWLFAAVLTRGDDFLVIGPVALVIFALVGALLGRGLSRHPSLLALVLFAPAAGALFGALVEIVLVGSPVGAGALAGALVAAAHLPPLSLILLAARAVPELRAGTWPHAAARRRVAVATAGSLAVATLGLLASRAFRASEDPTRHLTLELVAAMALGVIGGCLLADVRDLRRLRAAAAAHDPARFVAREAWHDVSGAEEIDFGAGDEEAVELMQRATAYRDAASVVTHLRGAVDRAASVLRAAIAADAFAITLTCVFFAMALAAEPSARATASDDDFSLQPYDVGVRVLERHEHLRSYPAPMDLERSPVRADDGSDVAYFVTHEPYGSGCLNRETRGAVSRVRCTEQLFGKVGVTLQPGGRMAIVWSFESGLLRYEWVHLESGALVRAGILHDAVAPGAVGSAGTYVIAIEDGTTLAVVDLWSGRTGRILSSSGRFQVDPATPWLPAKDDAERLQAVRRTGPEALEVVAIDPRAVLR